MDEQPTRTDELLTTGEAAALLGTSRQHVVDLCTCGKLPYRTVGTHRRVARGDVEGVARWSASRREESRSLWLHRAVAGKLALEPERSLARARRNLDRLRKAHPEGVVRDRFAEWESLLAGPLDELLDVLVSRSHRAVELRQSSPFAGVLSQNERAKALRTFTLATRAS